MEYSRIKGASVSATNVEVRLEGYSSYKNTQLDEWFDIPQLCGILSQRWARQQCTGPGLFGDSLRLFTLVEERSLGRFNGLSLIAGQEESVNSVVQRMQFVGTEPTTNCASDGNPLCTAAMRVADGVLAVWVFSRRDAGSIQRQAAAIKAFLRSAAGREENYEELKASLNRAI